MKKRFSEMQITGFSGEADAAVTVKKLVGGKDFPAQATISGKAKSVA